MMHNEMPPPPPYAPGKKRSVKPLLIGFGVGLVAAFPLGVVVGAPSSSSTVKPSVSARPEAHSAAPVEATPSSSYAGLGPVDFKIALKTKERQCFGEVGCNITVEPDITYLGDTADIDPDMVYDITYEVHGDEGGTITQTVQLRDQDELSFNEVYVSTASSSTKVTAEITDVNSF